MAVEFDFSNALIKCSSVDQLNVDDVAQCLSDYHFCVLRGLIASDNLRQGLKKLQTFVETHDDRPTTGEAASEIRGYFMKMSIGHARHGGVERPRFKRAIYNPLSEPDQFGLHDHFRTLAKIRNILSSKPLDFSSCRVEENLWTAARIHHFPSGGGFMVVHRDTVLPKVIKEEGFAGGFYQPLIIMSQKGEDFDVGGGVVQIGEKLYEYEDFGERGDIVIYDGSTLHGVNDIDPHLPYNQRSGSGRYSGLATLYKDMSGPKS